MPKYKFSEIAYNITDKKMPEPGDEELYIGLEHLDSGSLRVTRWGSDVELVGQKLVMQKGDILFGRRNTYLRRAAIAPHDGIFSAHGMIFRPNTAVVDPDYFPFFISSDYFMDAAIRISVGSLSPTVNWKTLKELEFYLPDLNQQRHTAELLSAANETKEAYQDLLIKSDELVKSQFIELFGDPEINPKGWYMPTVGEAVKDGYIAKPMDGNHGGKHPKGSDYVSSGVPFLMANNLIDGEADMIHCAFITKEQADSLDKGFAKDGDVLLTHKGTVGRTAILHCDLPYVMLTPQVTYYRPQKGISAEYLKAFFDTYYFQSELMKIASAGSTRAYIGITAQQNLKLIIPPIEQQNVFVAFVKQLDKSKFELKQAIANISELMKSLIQQDFSN